MSTYSFGQLVIGPPGSGKSTYCKAMKEFMSVLGRKVVIVNLDPANDALPYECSVDVSELITLQDVMDKLQLGPNGSLIYCMEYLEKNLEWLRNQLDKFRNQYFLFDCPGQVELFTHHCSVRNIAHQLEKWKFKVPLQLQSCACVHACVHERACMCMLVCVRVWVCVCMCVYVCACIDTIPCGTMVYMYVCMHLSVCA